MGLLTDLNVKIDGSLIKGVFDGLGGLAATVREVLKSYVGPATFTAEVVADGVKLYLITSLTGSLLINLWSIARVRIWNPSREVRAIHQEEAWQGSIWGEEHDLQQLQAASGAAPDARGAASVPADAAPAGALTIQVTALKERAEADRVASRLKGRGYEAYVAEPAPGTSMYRVRVGRFTDRAEADRVKNRLAREEKFKPWITR